MGCMFGKPVRIFVANPDHKGQGAEAITDFQRLGLRKQDINAFWTIFCAIDEDGSGEITLREFYRYFLLQQSDFIDSVFQLLDSDHSGKVDFREFVVALWNFCSYSLQNLAVFAFSLFDADGSNRLDLSEVRDLVQSVYGDKMGDNKRIERILDSLDSDGSGEITIQEFLLYNKQYPLLLYPAYSIQNHLRHKVIGERFWKRMEIRRETEFRRQNIFEIIEAVDKEAKAQIMGVDDYETILKCSNEQEDEAERERSGTAASTSQLLGDLKNAIRARTPSTPFGRRKKSGFVDEEYKEKDVTATERPRNNSQGSNGEEHEPQHNNSLANSLTFPVSDTGGVVGSHVLEYNSSEVV
mmetsp:Transcript_6181/g.8445  ORF Transcript_6181/g.8445 Transcript_6181/m.8445 type:complete len:354 (-) Transcript_6181:37-1098(-)